MSKRISLIITGFLLSAMAIAQTSPYKIYTNQGNEVRFEAMAEIAGQHEVIFFGELHNNSLAHWLQLQVLKSLHESGKKVVLGAEFFERDDQLNIDEWLAGKMRDSNFEAEAKLWKNYATDYKPLMLYAKKNQIPFVASNIPRKYASLVSRQGLAGLDSLSNAAKSYIAPLPIEVDKTLPGYVGMKDMMHGSGMHLDYMIEAQAVKDATMAYSLFDYVNKGRTILHVNGSYHSNNYEGIVWYLKRKFPTARIMTINTVEQDNIHTLDPKNQSSADFIIVLPLDSHKSY